MVGSMGPFSENGRENPTFPMVRRCHQEIRLFLVWPESCEISFQSFQKASLEALGFVALGYIRSASIRPAPSFGRGRTPTQNSRIGLLELSNTMTLALIVAFSRSFPGGGAVSRAWQIPRSALLFWRTAKVALFQCFWHRNVSAPVPSGVSDALPTVRKMPLDQLNRGIIGVILTSSGDLRSLDSCPPAIVVLPSFVEVLAKGGVVSS